ncbi:response regulator [Mangrovihabitans endophyticus]|uniref:Response regulator n=1 Tax=Mangrovihabitans endophyticus TaxID=1751298 RepID=A0A8J3FME1_9ACTN|nr:response regulator [Mangrovihabitans endophyticus]GGK75363.1 response regulator [Mangrovihabitans endophyticus]
MAEILNAIASLLWPLVVAALLAALFPVLKRFLSQSDSIDIEVAGAKVSVQRASEELRKLISDLQDRVNELEESMRSDSPGDSGPHLPPAPAAPTNAVLWVDDRLEANVYERARLAEAGRRIVQAGSTTSALQRIGSAGPFSVIISDMGRVEEGGKYNPRAGMDLLREIRRSGMDTPVVFYSSSARLDPVQAELQQAENVAYTTSPSELMRLLSVSSDA